MEQKNKEAYKTISEVAKLLNLINKKNGNLSTHTLRFWEKEFKQIKPLILSGNRRYYDLNTINLLKKIKFLLKEKGMTIDGVRKQLKSKERDLDEITDLSINTTNIKKKLNKISNLIKEIKK